MSIDINHSSNTISSDSQITVIGNTKFEGLDIADKVRVLKGQEVKVQQKGLVQGTVSFDLATANIFTAEIADDIEIDFINAPDNDQSQIAYLRLVNPGSFSITWPAGTAFENGSLGDLTASGTDLLAIWYDPVSSGYVVKLVIKDFR